MIFVMLDVGVLLCFKIFWMIMVLSLCVLSELRYLFKFLIGVFFVVIIIIFELLYFELVVIVKSV